MTANQMLIAGRTFVQLAFIKPNKTAPVNVADIATAITEIDDTLEATCGSLGSTDTIEVALNKALSDPVKSNLTADDKSLLLACTISSKHGAI